MIFKEEDECGREMKSDCRDQITKLAKLSSSK